MADLEERLRALQADIGALIKECREEAELTQSKLARLLSVDQSTISRIERGENECSISTLLKIADVFNMDLELSFTERDI